MSFDTIKHSANYSDLGLRALSFKRAFRNIGYKVSYFFPMTSHLNQMELRKVKT